MSQAPPPQADTLQDLARAEHLLVWALRAIALGHDDCPLLLQTFRRVYGPLGWQALAAWGVVVKTIGMTGGRRLKVHLPGCPCVSEDERIFVAVVAEAQDSLRSGDETRLTLRLRALVEGEPGAALVFAAQAVGRIFEGNGLRLPAVDRPDKRADACRPDLRTVH